MGDGTSLLGGLTVVGVAGVIGVSAALTACDSSRAGRAADGGEYNEDMDVWASAGRELARHPAVGSWRTDDDPDRPMLYLELHHDRTGVVKARSSRMDDGKVIPMKWRTGPSGRITLHRDFGPFPSHTPLLVMEVDGRRLRAIRTGAGLRATDRLVKAGADR